MLVVISDLHLSEGRRPITKKLAPAEDFFFDDQFARFLSYLDSRPGPVHLVINGDFCEFLQVGVSAAELDLEPIFADLTEKEKRYIKYYGAKTDAASSVFRLRKIAAGHPVFFAALRNFVAAGNRLTIVAGNHDAEWFWPDVRRAFRELVEAEQVQLADGGRSDNRGLTDEGMLDHTSKVEFAPWIFYDREFSVYIEHGNQYESLNSYRYWLYPVRPKNRDKLNLPVGSYFVRYLLNQIEATNPFADNIKPNTKYVAWALKNDPLGFGRLARLLWRFAVTIAKIWRRTGRNFSYSPADIEEFNAVTEMRLAEIAARFGIKGEGGSDDPLRQIIGLHKRPFNDVGKLRFMWRAFFANLDVLLFVFSGLSFMGFIFLLWHFGARNVFSAAGFIAGVAGALAGNAFYNAGVRMDEAMLDSAKRIGEILENSDNPAKYIVFGHTHEPAIVSFGNRWYFNTGTWDVIFEDQEELLRDKQQFAFLMIESPGAEPQLMRWNDPRGVAELLPLFDEA